MGALLGANADHASALSTSTQALARRQGIEGFGLAAMGTGPSACADLTVAGATFLRRALLARITGAAMGAAAAATRPDPKSVEALKL